TAGVRPSSVPLPAGIQSMFRLVLGTPDLGGAGRNRHSSSSMGSEAKVMARVAPPSSSRDQHQGPRHGGRWSWFPAKTVTRIVLVGVLISAAVAAVYLWPASQPQRPAVSVTPTVRRGDW